MTIIFRNHLSDKRAIIEDAKFLYDETDYYRIVFYNGQSVKYFKRHGFYLYLVGSEKWKTDI